MNTERADSRTGTGYCGSAIGALRFGDKDMVARSRKGHDKLTRELDSALAKLEALPFVPEEVGS